MKMLLLKMSKMSLFKLNPSSSLKSKSSSKSIDGPGCWKILSYPQNSSNLLYYFLRNIKRFLSLFYDSTKSTHFSEEKKTETSDWWFWRRLEKLYIMQIIQEENGVKITEGRR